MREASQGIGSRLRDRRLALKITQEELGAKVGKTKATINKYETGIVTNLSRDIIEKLANALDTTPAYLCGWDTELGQAEMAQEYYAAKRAKLKDKIDNQSSQGFPTAVQLFAGMPTLGIEVKKSNADLDFEKDLAEINSIYTFDQNERELVTIFHSLSVKKRTMLLMKAYELQEE